MNCIIYRREFIFKDIMFASNFFPGFFIIENVIPTSSNFAIIKKKKTDKLSMKV